MKLLGMFHVLSLRQQILGLSLQLCIDLDLGFHTVHSVAVYVIAYPNDFSCRGVKSFQLNPTLEIGPVSVSMQSCEHWRPFWVQWTADKQLRAGEGWTVGAHTIISGTTSEKMFVNSISVNSNKNILTARIILPDHGKYRCSRMIRTDGPQEIHELQTAFTNPSF